MTAHALSSRRLPAWALVALGGTAGGTTRWLVAQHLSSAWPGATATVNLVGALALGILTGLVLTRPEQARWADAKLLLGTGFCGALTTFSTLMSEVVALSERHDAGVTAAAGWLAVQVLAGIGLAWLGLSATSRRTASGASGRPTDRPGGVR